MDKLSPMEAKDRKIAIAETNKHLKIIKSLKNEKQEQKEIQELMVVDINKPLS